MGTSDWFLAVFDNRLKIPVSWLRWEVAAAQWLGKGYVPGWCVTMTVPQAESGVHLHDLGEWLEASNNSF